ncbi:MAG TPA: DUF4360 domain-containing protein [Pilimelia sp.]|nr:DUF4360 domain-containing protein [Pilimelia sp.]
MTIRPGVAAKLGTTLFVTLATVLALSLPGSAAAGSGSSRAGDTESPPPDRIVVDVVTVNGSGCPAGTAEVEVSPDNTAFTVTYSQYVARDGGGADPIDFRKNCQLNLLVHVPQGFTYAIARADYRGFAHLKPGSTALQRAAYYFQGSSDTVYSDHPFSGPFRGDWHTVDVTDVAALVFAPCGRNVGLNINTELRVNAGASNARSIISMDSTAGRINNIFHFHWKHC